MTSEDKNYAAFVVSNGFLCIASEILHNHNPLMLMLQDEMN